MKRFVSILVGIAITYLVIFTMVLAVNSARGSESELANRDFITFFNYYNVIRVSDYPLFRVGGDVNEYVLESLISILNYPSLNPMMREKKVYWPTGLVFEYSSYTAITAADFSDFVVPKPKNMNHSGAIIIQLFETVPDKYGVDNGHLSEFTSQWWQLVYRSSDDGNDVLTLWMVQPYRLTPFNGTRYDTHLGHMNEGFFCFPDIAWHNIPESSINTILCDTKVIYGLPACNSYFFEGNFSASIARSNLLRDAESLFKYFDIEQYLVAPYNLPGQWQSSLYQTGTNIAGYNYVNEGLGAAGLIWGSHLHFNIVNGKDGLSVGPYYGHWPHTVIEPTHYDLLWLPSDFEVRSMGHNKDRAFFQTFIADARVPSSGLRWNYRHHREEDWRYEADTSGGRSGLWQLNGFDRAFCDNSLEVASGWESRLVWLRSANSNSIGNVNMVYFTGNRYGYGVHQLAGMRPALHLSISQLRRHT